MITFEYRARDPLGKTQEGTLEAASLEAARQQLRREGYHVLGLAEAEEQSDRLLWRGISRQELIYVTAQLAVMVDTGITLSTALGGIIDQETNPSLRRVLLSLKQTVESGEDFSTALDQYPKLFDRTFISLVKASEATGSLGAMLDRIAGYLRKDTETRGKVKAAMAYPMVMMVLAGGVAIFLLTYILPKFTPLFRIRHTELPGPTKLMMGLSDGILNYWYLWLTGLILFVAGFFYGRCTPTGRKILDWIKINVPILGTVFRKVTISRSIRTLGTLLASGVPVMESLKLAAAVSGNVYYEELWQKVLNEVAGGKRICEVLQGSALFPRVLVQMIASGEETGKLDVVLEKVSRYYDGEVETTLKTATSLIEPIMIILMGVVVGTIGLALMLPIFSLSQQP